MSLSVPAGNCPVCRDFYNDPRILDCGHTICKACVDGIARSTGYRLHISMVYTGKLTCPVCRHPTTLDRKGTNGLKKNYQLEDAVQLILQTWTDQDEKCEEHESDFVMYCGTCQILLCPKCIIEKHKDHTFIDIDTQYATASVELEKDLGMTKEIKEKIKNTEMRKDVEIKEVQKMESASEWKINSCFRQIESQMETRKAEILSVLSSMVSALEIPVQQDKQLLREEEKRLIKVEEASEKLFEKNKVYLIKNLDQMKRRINGASENAKEVLDKINPTKTYPAVIPCGEQVKLAVPRIHLADNVYLVRGLSRGQPIKITKCIDCNFDIEKVKEENEQLQDNISQLMDENRHLGEELDRSSASNSQLQNKIDELENALQKQTDQHQQMKQGVMQVLGFETEVISPQKNNCEAISDGVVDVEGTQKQDKELIECTPTDHDDHECPDVDDNSFILDVDTDTAEEEDGPAMPTFEEAVTSLEDENQEEAEEQTVEIVPFDFNFED